MPPLYTLSLVPVLAVALLLLFTAALHARNARGLVMYCLGVAVWSAALMTIAFPSIADIGRRLAAVGTFIAAAYLHAAFDFTRQRSYALVWLAYGTAAVITLAGALLPGLIYDPASLSRGALFWHSIGLAVVALGVPLIALARAFRSIEPERRSQLQALIWTGVLGYSGSWINAFLLTEGKAQPYGMFLVLASLFLLAHVVRGHQPPRERRLLERSLIYATIAAVLSAGFLFGVLGLMIHTGEPLRESSWGLSAFFLLVMALLAFEPIRQHAQELLGRRLVPDHAGTRDLADALAVQEQRADHAERLAELGTMASAVAHEVRNPLGVLAAHLRVLEREGAAAETIATMRAQIDRASHFIDDLLRYGRPRPLELRMVELEPTVELAFSTAHAGLPEPRPAVELTRDGLVGAPMVEADQAQLLQILVVVLENACLALGDVPAPRIHVACSALATGSVRLDIDDNGPGVPAELRGRLFEPFTTSRKRGGARTGTGLGLAIARGVVERHGGTIRAGESPLGGARFTIEIPRHQAVLAAAASPP